MRKVLILAGILIASAVIVGLEFWRFPERATSLQSSFTEGKSLIDRSQVAMLVPFSQVSEKNFELAGISGPIEKKTRTVDHLFGTIRISESDQIVILKSDFFEGNTEKALVSIYEIFPLADTTVSKLFLSLSQKLEAPFVGDVENGINRTDDFGRSSFYFNSENAPERSFLLGATSNRILGFEYLKENHDRLLPLLRELLPPVEEKTSAN